MEGGFSSNSRLGERQRETTFPKTTKGNTLTTSQRNKTNHPTLRLLVEMYPETLGQKEEQVPDQNIGRRRSTSGNSSVGSTDIIVYEVSLITEVSRKAKDIKVKKKKSLKDRKLRKEMNSLTSKYIIFYTISINRSENIQTRVLQRTSVD